jgi:hypothetical protein
MKEEKEKSFGSFSLFVNVDCKRLNIEDEYIFSLST